MSDEWATSAGPFRTDCTMSAACTTVGFSEYSHFPTRPKPECEYCGRRDKPDYVGNCNGCGARIK